MVIEGRVLSWAFRHYLLMPALALRPSSLDELDLRVEESKIAGIGRHDPLAPPSCADHHMGVDDVGCPARCQKPPDVGGIDPVKATTSVPG
jgi:hypothetical protein